MGFFTDYETGVDHYERDFYARLTTVATGSGDFASLNLYGFVEVFPAGDGGPPVDVPDGRNCDPTGTVQMFALEANNQLITVPGSTPTGFTEAGPYIAHMRFHSMMNGNPVFIFDAPASSSGGGSIALLDKSGSTVDAACEFLEMDSRGIILVTNLSANHDQFSVVDASATQPGVVNLTTQEFAGAKTFSTTITGKNSVQTGEVIVFTGSGSNGRGGFSTLANPSTQYLNNGFAYFDSSGTNQNSFQIVGSHFNFNSGPILITGGIATNAVVGFLGLPTCAGTPTGTPVDAALLSSAPLVFDSTNNIIYVWNPASSTWKKTVALT